MQIGVNYRGMNIALPANRSRVSQPLRHRFDGRHHIPPSLCFEIECLEPHQGASGQDRTGPGAKVLGGEFLSGLLTEIGVDVYRIDRSRRTVLVQVLEQFLARQVLAALDDT